MQRIKRIVILCGGVLLPTITDAVLAQLQPDVPADPRLMLTLHRLEWRLLTGAMALDLYCANILALTESTVSAAGLIERVPNETRFSPGILPLLGEISERTQLRLVSDYPPEWLEPISLRGDFPLSAFDGPCTFLQDLRWRRDYRSLFRELLACGLLSRGNTMWVDWHSLRCMAAVREGLDSGLFVDAVRLRRDLKLWGIIPPPD